MKTLLSLVLLVPTLGLAVDNPSVPAEPSDARKALASELLDAMGAEKQAETAIAQLKRSQEHMLKMAQLPPGQEEKSREMQSRIRAVIAEEFAWERWKDHYVRIYAASLEEKEMQGAIAFYRSPAGQAYMAKTPDIQRQLQEVVMQRMTSVNARARSIAAEYAPQQPMALPMRRPGPRIDTGSAP